MKTNKILLASLSVMFAVSVACTSETSNQSGAEDDHAGHTHETSASEVGNPQFNDENTKAVYEHYIHLKTALVKADAKEAQSGASELSTALSNVANTTGADLASKIASASDIKAQRDNLDALTVEVEKVIKSGGLKSGKVFKQYCPMAQDGDGAYWLAGESDINNPYYGDEMLECGEVKEEIK